MNVMVGRGSTRGHGRWLVTGLVVAGLAAAGFGAYAELTGGSNAMAEAAPEAAPVTLHPLGRGDVNRLVLTPQAIQRIGIETAPVHRRLVGKQLRTVLPYSALIYGADGQVWAYTHPARNTFVRRRVSVDDITGALAVLRDRLRAGERVVTVGAAELFGSEVEFEE
jgi:hypothetical protein